jgi:hypothetical protein
MWFENSELRTYNDLQTHFSKCRSPDKGRPLKAWGRVFKNGDAFEIQVNGKKLGTVTPDNIMTFVAPIGVVRSNAQTLVGAFHRAMPFILMRVGIGRYRITHASGLSKNVDTSEYGWNSQWLRSEAPEYFEGIQFDLTTGECLNRKPDILKQVDTDVRTEWIRCLRKFKRAIKVRAKLGVLDSLLADAKANKAVRQHPDWDSNEWQDDMVNAIKTGDIPTPLLLGIAMSTLHRGWRVQGTTQEFIAEVDTLCNSYSVQLRRKFGVFGDAE